MDSMERDDLLAQAEKQHAGGTGGAKGYRYQDVVTVIELLRGAMDATRGGKWHIEYIQEAKESFTDDLHVAVTPRRHIQIKSVDGQSWEEALRIQFANERKLHPTAKLELCVHDLDIEKSLKRNRARWGLEEVNVYCIPIEQTRRPYAHKDVRDMLNRFLRRTYPDFVFMNLWSQIQCAWTHHFGDQGFLDDVFDFVCKNSELPIAFEKPDLNLVARILKWNVDQRALIFSTNSRTLYIEFPGTELSTVSVSLEQVPAEFWSEGCPESAWDVFHRLGQFLD